MAPEVTVWSPGALCQEAGSAAPRCTPLTLGPLMSHRPPAPTFPTDSWMARILLPSPGVAGRALGAPGADDGHSSSPKRLSAAETWAGECDHVGAPATLPVRHAAPTHLQGTTGSPGGSWAGPAGFG